MCVCVCVCVYIFELQTYAYRYTRVCNDVCVRMNQCVILPETEIRDRSCQGS